MDQNERDQDLSNERNKEETGKPVQLDKDGKEPQGGKEHQGNQPHTLQTEQKPDQGQRIGQRMP